jgi:O-antigen/teichoic acid export membrane protein
MAKIKETNNYLYIKNALILMIDSVIKILAGFILTVLIARFFGPGKFGDINYVLAVVEILQIFVLFGFDDIVLRDFGQKNISDNIILGSAVALRVLFAAITYVAGIFLFIFFLGKSFISLYLIVGINLFIYAFWSLKQWFQINSLNKYIAISSQICFWVMSVTKFLVIIFTLENLKTYAWALVFSQFCEVFFLYLFINKRGVGIHYWKTNFSYQKKLLHDSLPILFQNFAIIIYMKIDQLMIGKILTSSELGIYSVAVLISQVVYFFPGAIIGAFYPKIADKKRRGEPYEDEISTLGAIVIIITVIFALCCTFIIPYFLPLFFGKDYISATDVIKIHSWAGIFVALAEANKYWLVLNNLQHYSMIATTIGAVCNVVLNFIFIPRIGINGAALATVISQFIVSYGVYLFFKDRRSLIIRTNCILKIFRLQTYTDIVEILKGK